jgi:hypothetical protein
MTYEKWFETYRPVRNKVKKSAPFDGCLYDAWSELEKQVAHAAYVKSPNCIWTFMEMDGRIYIIAGWVLVNRLGYFVASVPYEDEANAPEVALGRI